MVALAFKVVHDKNKGLIVFLRIYSGELTAGALKNVNKNVTERATKVIQVESDDLVSISTLSVGNV